MTAILLLMFPLDRIEGAHYHLNMTFAHVEALLEAATKEEQLRLTELVKLLARAGDELTRLTSTLPGRSASATTT